MSKVGSMRLHAAAAISGDTARDRRPLVEGEFDDGREKICDSPRKFIAGWLKKVGAEAKLWGA